MRRNGKGASWGSAKQPKASLVGDSATGSKGRGGGAGASRGRGKSFGDGERSVSVTAAPKGKGARWSVASVVHRQAADAVAQLLASSSSRKGGTSIKSLTLAPHIQAKKATYAVTHETLRCRVLYQLFVPPNRAALFYSRRYCHSAAVGRATTLSDQRPILYHLAT
jgi:hypothetical protein|eukprot:CAMPEP_0177790868 /NCGR_PEP_ID=MMETSP0491_2-20121128/23600_1 /TAXON_ID=63592 /ORGANISM="Tetraselmis chuii, Strain PLY429" /LENGTH=165 /DNA_ID=CAMNT_0019313003 /DNA_START=53 /DNA_END=550 /DNA_ORIENTATION=-